ncbi:SPFH domain-containing protein [Chitinophagaceae bacterium 26-R-25]|nr:SPFH domain-containing protein [Chitinophagaceae bacterium 26-R-25]
MGIFSNGGIMDVIRCDEQEYLVHKWSPSGAANSAKRENAIRFGSSIRVKDGEVAVFVYNNKGENGTDYLVGPYDGFLKTINIPFIADLVGRLYNDASPFPAEIYFINLAGNVQIKFGIPYFDICDPRFPELVVPCAVRGTLTFNLQDYKNFIKLNRLIDFELEDFHNQIKDFMVRKAKSVILNVPFENNISPLVIERKLDDICTIVQEKLQADMLGTFGVNLRRFDISAIEIDKENANYLQLKKATADQQTKFAEAQTDVNIANLSENARIARKDAEMQVEGKNFGVYQLDQQADVLKTVGSHLGGGPGGEGGGIVNSMAGMTTGIMIGGMLGNQVGNMMNKIGGGTPPPMPNQPVYFIGVNGQQQGSFTFEQLRQMAQTGQFTRTHYVWKDGMANWELAEKVGEFSSVFPSVPPAFPKE